MPHKFALAGPLTSTEARPVVLTVGVESGWGDPIAAKSIRPADNTPNFQFFRDSVPLVSNLV